MPRSNSKIIRTTLTTTSVQITSDVEFSDTNDEMFRRENFIIENLSSVSVFIADEANDGGTITAGTDLTTLSNYITIPANSERMVSSQNLQEFYGQSASGSATIQITPVK